jgi:hypothetical protein
MFQSQLIYGLICTQCLAIFNFVQFILQFRQSSFSCLFCACVFGEMQFKKGSDNYQPNMCQTLFSLQKNKESQASILSTQSYAIQVITQI